MTTAVLQAHHAVQTLPEVSPEFTQAIVQTDISGPITASEVTNADLIHTAIGKAVPEAELQQSAVAQDDMPHTVNEPCVDSSALDSHGGLTAELQVEGPCDKGVQSIKQTGELLLVPFIGTIRVKEIVQRLKTCKRVISLVPQIIKQYHRKVLLNSFHFNGCT